MKKILFSPFYFPPVNNSASKEALDWVLSFTKQGWEVDIITYMSNSKYYDRLILVELPKSCNIYRILEPLIYRAKDRIMLKSVNKSQCGNISPLKGFIRRMGNWIFHKILKPCVFIPDEYIFTSLTYLIKFLVRNRSRKYDLIISLGPPLSVHIIGYISKLVFRKPWIAVWNDPITFGPFSEDISPFKNYINSIIEAKLISNSNKISVTTYETREAFMKLYNIPKQKIIVNPMYVHKEEHTKIFPKSSYKFRVAYTGLLSAKHFNPFAFIEALKMFVDEGKNIEFYIIGKFNPEHEFKDYIIANNLTHAIKYLGSNLDRDEIISYQKGATILLLLGWKGGYQVPMKTYEYIVAQRPILTIQYDERDAASNIVKRLKRGVCVRNDVQEIKETLIKLYELWKNKRLDKEFDLSENDEFSFENHIRVLEKAVIELA